jgi:hypothetical protein
MLSLKITTRNLSSKVGIRVIFWLMILTAYPIKNDNKISWAISVRKKSHTAFLVGLSQLPSCVMLSKKGMLVVPNIC